MSDSLVKTEGVSKKFCKSLKRSMLYGVQDIAKNMFGLLPETGELRPDEFWAVDNISFELKQGECLGLIGPNGSGKSTLLKMLNGIISPDKGKIIIKGRMGALIEVGAGFHPMLTARENIYVNGAILGMNKKEIDSKFDQIVAFAELEKFLDTPVKFFSSGMYVRLGFAIAAHIQPDVLIIDEILAVGDASFQFRCLQHIKSLQAAGTVIIIVTHNLGLIPSFCDSALLVLSGQSKDKMPAADVVDIYKKLVRERLLYEENPLNLRSIKKEQDGDCLRSGKRERLEIVSFRVLNASGKQCLRFALEEDVIIEMDVRALADTPRVGAAFLVKDAFGARIIGRTTHHNDISSDLKSGQNIRFSFIFKNLLKPAAYSISIAANWLSIPGNLALAIAEDQIDNACIFESSFTPGLDVYAMIALPVKCEAQKIT